MLGSIGGGMSSGGGGIAGIGTLGQTWRVSTPLWLKAAILLACLPIAAFTIALHVGLDRNDSTVQTVGEDATGGITVAQRIKLNLAELDSIAVRGLVVAEPLGAGGFPEDYNAKRTELHENLVSAAAQSPGAAYEQTLVNIDYVLGHYHALLADSFAATVAEDPATALAKYDAAHEIMGATLLPEADRFDKANTYVLNDSYGRQKDRSVSTKSWIGVASVVLVAALVALQVALHRKFRRVFNVALVGATLVAVVWSVAAFSRIEYAADQLSRARDDSFDAVHQLARARAVAVVARQAQGDFLLDPSAPDEADALFQSHADRIFRIAELTEDEVVEYAEKRRIPSGSAGYLALVVGSGISTEGDLATRDALHEFGAFLDVDESIRDLVSDGEMAEAIGTYGPGADFAALATAIDDAQAIEQRSFDRHVDEAESATSGLSRVNVVVAVGILALVGIGLLQRLREYTT